MGGLGAGAHRTVEEDGDLDSPHVLEHRTGALSALSVLATEQHNVLRSIFRVNTNSAETFAEVQQQRETDREPGQCMTEVGGPDHTTEQQSSLDKQTFNDAVSAEMKRVQQTVLTLDPERDVVMRFDFLSGHESRVKPNCATNNSQQSASSVVALSPSAHSTFTCRLLCYSS